MEIVIATSLAFVLGMITGVAGLFAISCLEMRKAETNVTGPVITRTETEIIDCLSCAAGKRKKQGSYVYRCENCGDDSFWVGVKHAM